MTATKVSLDDNLINSDEDSWGWSCSARSHARNKPFFATCDEFSRVLLLG
jgi:hypothetical protein